jgi:hypothetical protein
MKQFAQEYNAKINEMEKIKIEGEDDSTDYCESRSRGYSYRHSGRKRP